MEVMMSDMPHVMYHPPKGGTQEEEENRLIIMRHQREQIKKGGLKSLGIELEVGKKVINGNDLLERLNKK